MFAIYLAWKKFPLAYYVKLCSKSVQTFNFNFFLYSLRFVEVTLKIYYRLDRKEATFFQFPPPIGGIINKNWSRAHSGLECSETWNVEKVNFMKGVGIKSNEGDIRRKGSKHPCHRESRMRPLPGLCDNEYLSWEVKCRISRRLRRREREREREGERERENSSREIYDARFVHLKERRGEGDTSSSSSFIPLKILAQLICSLFRCQAVRNLVSPMKILDFLNRDIIYYINIYIML